MLKMGPELRRGALLSSTQEMFMMSLGLYFELAIGSAGETKAETEAAIAPKAATVVKNFMMNGLEVWFVCGRELDVWV